MYSPCNIVHKKNLTFFGNFIHHGLFIKTADTIFIFKNVSLLHYSSLKIIIHTFSNGLILTLCRHFLPFRRADLTAFASFQNIRGEKPQLHALRLATATTSTRE